MHFRTFGILDKPPLCCGKMLIINSIQRPFSMRIWVVRFLHLFRHKFFGDKWHWFLWAGCNPHVTQLTVSQHWCKSSDWKAVLNLQRGMLLLLVLFTVKRLTEIFRLTGFSINRTETGNMATALSVKNF